MMRFNTMATEEGLPEVLSQRDRLVFTHTHTHTGQATYNQTNEKTTVFQTIIAQKMKQTPNQTLIP